MGTDPPAATADAFGSALLDAFAGGDGLHTIERDDGFTETMPADVYFTGPEDWPPDHCEALDRLQGRVLDIGAGAGRHTLHLQHAGVRPLALDVSPGAVEVCRRRGVGETFLGTVHELVDAAREPFEAALMMGHNLAVLASDDEANRVLASLRRLLLPDGVVIGTGLDPYLTDEPGNLAYHERNRRGGRMPGQIRMRVMYRSLVGEWFDWLFLAPAELRSLAARSGWTLESITDPDPTYLAVLRPS
jgi:SAM-dependent methyltransferase